VCRQRQTEAGFLQRSLRTKEKRDAERRAIPLLLEFDRILAQAEALIAERPLRQSLTEAEIKAIADFYASELASDEDDNLLYTSFRRRLAISCHSFVCARQRHAEVQLLVGTNALAK